TSIRHVHAYHDTLSCSLWPAMPRRGASERSGHMQWVHIGFTAFLFFFFKQKTAYEIGLGIPAEPLFRSNPASTIPAEEASAPARSQALSSGNAAARYSRVSFPLSAADLPPSPTKSSNLSETAEVPACNVPSRTPLPALSTAPETKTGTAAT